MTTHPDNSSSSDISGGVVDGRNGQGSEDISAQARGFLEMSVVAQGHHSDDGSNTAATGGGGGVDGGDGAVHGQSGSAVSSKWDEPAGGVSEEERLRKALEAARSIEQSLSHKAAATADPNADVSQQTQAAVLPPMPLANDFQWSDHGIDPALISVPVPTPGDQLPFMREIEINDVRNLNILTKASTLKEIEKESGASIVTRGRYYDVRRGEMPPTGEVPADDRPLSLFVAAETPESLDKALVKIGEVINMQQQKNFLIEKVYIGIDNPMYGYNVPANVIGPKGAYVKFISNNCNGTRVYLRGRGSAQRDTEDEDPDEPMHLHISGIYQNQMERAKKLAESLVAKVKRDYARFVARKKQQMQQQQQHPQQHPGPGGVPPYQAYPGAPPAAGGAPGVHAPYGYPPMQHGYPPYGAVPPGYPPHSQSAEPAPPGLEPAPPGMEPSSDTSSAPAQATATPEQMEEYYKQYYAYYNQYYAGGAGAAMAQQQQYPHQPQVPGSSDASAAAASVQQPPSPASQQKRHLDGDATDDPKRQKVEANEQAATE